MGSKEYGRFFLRLVFKWWRLCESQRHVFHYNSTPQFSRFFRDNNRHGSLLLCSTRTYPMHGDLRHLELGFQETPAFLTNFKRTPSLLRRHRMIKNNLSSYNTWKYLIKLWIILEFLVIRFFFHDFFSVSRFSSTVPILHAILKHKSLNIGLDMNPCW